MAIILWLCYGYTIFTMVMNYGYYNHEEIHLILNHRNLEIFVLYRWSNLNLQMASGWKKRWNHPFRDCRNLISPRHLDLSILNNTILRRSQCSMNIRMNEKYRCFFWWWNDWIRAPPCHHLAPPLVVSHPVRFSPCCPWSDPKSSWWTPQWEDIQSKSSGFVGNHGKTPRKSWEIAYDHGVFAMPPKKCIGG